MTIAYESDSGRVIPALAELHFPDGNYRQIETSFSTRLKSDRLTVCFSESWFGQGLMCLVSRVRAEVKKNLDAKKITPVAFDPKFTKLKRRWRGRIDATEVDLSSAYLTAAKMIGAISPETFRRLSTVTKQSRLTAIGALGTRRIITTWKDGAVVANEVEEEPTRIVWDWIVAEVDRVMNQLVDDNTGSLFYWADAAFIERREAKDFKVAVGAEGYGFKSKDVKLYILKNTLRVNDGRIFSL